MGIGVLGPLRVDGPGGELGRRDRVVLSALVVAAGSPVSTEQLADALWGDAPPASWAKVVQGCVVRLRKLLGSAAIESGEFGYRLTLTEAELDSASFEHGLRRARQALDDDDPDRAAYLASEALGLWRGRPLADLEEWEPGRIRATQLDGQRMDAEELLVEARIRGGHAVAVLEQARALVERAPFRERRWVLLATALHQCGRQAEALSAIHRARAMLADELGLDPGRELAELELQLLRQDPTLHARPGREVSADCPYQGLRPYDAQDADSFFGRDEEVAVALRRLRDVGVLAVVGPSGVGKSSLIRAGVVAALLRTGGRPVVTTPGAHPVSTLQELIPGSGQVLVVDQTEEAITVCADPQERAAYFAAIAEHVSSGGSLVLSLRADHLGDLAPYPAIARIVESGLLLLGPMDESALRRAIEGPAGRAGLRLEPGLVDLVIRDVAGEPAALPLLSHVLRETWQRREGPTLTVEAYRTTGGVRHAVAQSAEALYESLDNPARDWLRGLLLRLVQPSEDGDPVRTRVPRDRVATDDAHARLLESLVAARLVTIDGDSVQVAHEALFREWPRLRGWLDDDVDGQRLFRHLSAAADSWTALGRPDSELYRGVRLSRALEWRNRARPDLNGTEREFLDACLDRNRDEERAAAERLAFERVVNRRLRGALGGVAALLVVAMVAGIAALGSARQARNNQVRAETAAHVADARRAGAQALVTEDRATSLLLAVAALQADDSAQAWDTLGAALMRNRSLLNVRDLDGVVSVTASGDGAYVAVSDPVRGVRLFDARTLEPRDFPDHTVTNYVRFSPDSSLLAAGRTPWEVEGMPSFFAQPVRLYDLAEGRLAAQQLGGWPTLVGISNALAFSRDGGRIVAAMRRWDLAARDWSPLGVVCVWDLADRDRPVLTLRLPSPTQAALGPDGRHAYVVTQGTYPLRVYDVDSGKLVRRATSHALSQSPALASEVSPDGSTLAVATGNQILVFDTQSLRALDPALVEGSAEFRDVHFSPDGRLLLAAASDGAATVWDASSGVQLRHLVPGGQDPAALPGRPEQDSREAAFGDDGRTVFTATDDLMKWDVSGPREPYAEGGLIASPGGHLGLTSAAPDGWTVARQRADRLWFVDERTGTSSASVSTPELDPDVAGWSPDGRWFLASAQDDVLRIWDARTGQEVAARGSETWGWDAVAFDAAGDRVYAIESGRGALLTLDRATLANVGPPVVVRYGMAVDALLPEHSTGRVLVVLREGLVLRVDPVSRQGERPGEPLGWTQLDLTLGAEGVHPALSPDGTRLVGLDSDRQVRVLDLRTLTWLGATTKADWGSDHTFVFSPDGAQVASVAPDRIRLWDGRTGEYQASLPLPRRSLGASIAYLPDSSGLLVTTLDGGAWTSPTQTGTWVSRACAAAGRSLTPEEWGRFFPGQAYRATCPGEG